MSKNGLFAPMRLACHGFCFAWNLTLRFFCTKYAILIKFAAYVFIIPIDSHDETLSALPCDVYIGGSQLVPSWSTSTASSGSRRGSMNWTAESCTQEAQKYIRQWEDLQYSNSNGQGRRSWQSVTLSRISKYISEFYVPVKLHTCQTVRYCW